MTTGYTVYIQDGVITTGKDFLKLCLSNFDIAINMKNEILYVDLHFKKCYNWIWMSI